MLAMLGPTLLVGSLCACVRASLRQLEEEQFRLVCECVTPYCGI